MPTFAMFQVDAFTDRLFAGNPASVLILQNDWLADHLMQSIAAENNLSETAFARPNGHGWDLRWFTPTREVDVCGHATLATGHVLASELGVAGELTFSTRIGELRVEPAHGAYILDLPTLPPEPFREPPALAELFPNGWRAAFHGADNIFVELDDEAAIRAFVPDAARIAALPAAGLCITAPGQDHDFVSRYFAPAFGIEEDPVTGSTHATLTPHWAARLGRTDLSAFQCSRRGGAMTCEIDGVRVRVTGRAVTFMTATIRVPD